MKKQSLIARISLLIAGVAFIISGIIGDNKDITFISLGCGLIAIGIVLGMQYKKSNKK